MFNRMRILKTMPQLTAVILAALVFALAGCHQVKASSNTPQSSTQQFGSGPIEVKPPDWTWQATHFNADAHPVAATNELAALVRARLITANNIPRNNGKLELTIALQARAGVPDYQLPRPPSLFIHIPLSGAGDSYGESRSCYIGTDGVPASYTYVAGLDEKNYIRFEPMAAEREFRFSLNKYICRALAAPYSCSRPHEPPSMQSTPPDVSHWLIEFASVDISSAHSPARADISDITLTSSGKPFDYATCAKVAPSDGMCCVAHKETAWHCGTKPEGKGWHQVSGSCYHRETGASCSD
jgi:hypothetical protein